MITKSELACLDWIKILDDAIENRPTSWSEFPVSEWKNASDETFMSVLKEMKKKGLIEK